MQPSQERVSRERPVVRNTFFVVYFNRLHAIAGSTVQKLWNTTTTVHLEHAAAPAMKSLFSQVLLAVLAASSLATPMRDQQVPLSGSIGLQVHHPRPKAPSSGTHSPMQKPAMSGLVKGAESKVSEATRATNDGAPSPPSKSTTSAWDWLSDAFKKDTAGAPHSCFCAGVSVCCYSAQGLSCNYGVCGI
jgi:hypothetical protein